MNQKTLIIAVVALVAILIVIGVWLAGTAGSGPLAGTLCENCVAPNQLKTSLALSATEVAGCGDGVMERLIQFSGTLMDAQNNPVPERNVTIYDRAGNAYTTKTDQNGAFSEQRGINDCCQVLFYAVFNGDFKYEGSASTTVSVPASTSC